MKITLNPRLQYETRDDAERMIEVHCPAGYLYEVYPVRTTLVQVPLSFAVKVYDGDDCRFIGFAYDAEAEADFVATEEGLHG